LHTLFISDLHLSAKQPQITRVFLHFMRHAAPGAEALYILGDLFEYWAGDDDLDDPFHRQITRALCAVAAGGTRLFVMHGNRDFLMAEKLAAACHATLLPDPVLIDLYGTPTLLSHGDALCTDDIAYQTFRRLVRDTTWQQQFLARPLAQRKAQIEELRARSENEKQTKNGNIMDVNAQAVAELLREHRYPRLIHGHTHHLGHHLHQVDSRSCERWVLGDWDATGNALRCDAQGCRFELFQAPAGEVHTTSGP
jgi:UDP-2,3-diacylglucosamine hydrolase